MPIFILSSFSRQFRNLVQCRPSWGASRTRCSLRFFSSWTMMREKLTSTSTVAFCSPSENGTMPQILWAGKLIHIWYYVLRQLGEEECDGRGPTLPEHYNLQHTTVFTGLLQHLFLKVEISLTSWRLATVTLIQAPSLWYSVRSVIYSRGNGNKNSQPTRTSLF